MITCKEAARRVAEGALAEGSPLDRLGLRLHFLICDGCRRFRRQVGLLGEAARRWNGGLGAPASAASFEARIVEKLRDPRG